jgi:hypothetical protein
MQEIGSVSIPFQVTVALLSVSLHKPVGQRFRSPLPAYLLGYRPSVKPSLLVIDFRTAFFLTPLQEAGVICKQLFENQMAFCADTNFYS